MSHYIEGLVARLDHLREHAPQITSDAFIAPLQHGYGLLLTDMDVTHPEDLSTDSVIPPHLAKIAAVLSKTGPVAYVATNYWGGGGHQCAAVWVAGKQTKTLSWCDGRPINNALKSIGVERIGSARLSQAEKYFYDEFDTIGLGKFRFNKAWIDFANWSSLRQAANRFNSLAEAS